MRAKQFFYACAGILMITLAYTIGANEAKSQLGGQVAGASAISNSNSTDYVYVMTQTGDVYRKRPNDGASVLWDFRGNVFSATVQVESKTWGSAKESYRK